MKDAQGYAVWTGPDGRASKEMDTFTCFHCNNVVFVPAKATAEQMGGFCRMCMKQVCGPCADKGVCTPFEKKLEEVERRARMLKAIGI